MATSTEKREGTNENIVSYTIASLPKLYITERIDELGFTENPNLKFLVQKDFNLQKEDAQICIPAGSIISRNHDYLIITLPTGKNEHVDIAGNEATEIQVTEIEEVDLRDPQYPEIAARIGLTRNQMLAVAAMFTKTISNIDLEDVAANIATAHNPEKKARRQLELALTKEINALFETLFINGYEIQGTSKIGDKEFNVHKNNASHGGVIFEINTDDNSTLEFNNRATLSKPTERNKKWNGLREWHISFNGRPISEQSVADNLAKVFNEKAPLQILLEALQTFQADEASKEYFEKRS